MNRGFFRAFYDGPVRSEDGTVLDNAPLRFTAATEGVKRDGLDLVIGGGRFDNFRRSGGPFMWAHQYDRAPIGRTDITVDGDRIVADVTFDAADIFAAEVRRKYQDGFLSAVSIGWQTNKVDGNRVTDWELLEISAVPIPADPDALIERQLVGARSLAEQLRDLIDPDVDTLIAFGADARAARAGAVLSAKNKQLVRSARDAMTSAAEALDALLTAAEPGDDTDRKLPADALLLSPETSEIAARVLANIREKLPPTT